MALPNERFMSTVPSSHASQPAAAVDLEILPLRLVNHLGKWVELWLMLIPVRNSHNCYPWTVCFFDFCLPRNPPSLVSNIARIFRLMYTYILLTTESYPCIWCTRIFALIAAQASIINLCYSFFNIRVNCLFLVAAAPNVQRLTQLILIIRNILNFFQYSKLRSPLCNPDTHTTQKANTGYIIWLTHTCKSNGHTNIHSFFYWNMHRLSFQLLIGTISQGL